jgi:hypothetical protein
MRAARPLGVASALAVLALLVAPAIGFAQTAPCDPTSPAAVEFVGLPSRVIIGKEEIFWFAPTYESESEPTKPYRVRMMDVGTGRVFFSGNLSRLSERLYTSFDLNDRGATRIELSYSETDATTGVRCDRVIAQDVRPNRWILFPSKCETGLQRRPRSVIVACGDGNLQLKRMRWRGWNHLRTRGRGLAWINDCIPFCAAGTFHYVRARVTLSKPRLCPDAERYVYTRLKYRYVDRPSWITWSGTTVRFPCSFYSGSF